MNRNVFSEKTEMKYRLWITLGWLFIVIIGFFIQTPLARADRTVNNFDKIKKEIGEKEGTIYITSDQVEVDNKKHQDSSWEN